MNKIVVNSSVEESLDPLDDFLFWHFWEFWIFVKEYFESGLEKWKELRVIDFDDTLWKRQTALDELWKWAKLNRQEKWNIWLIAKYCWLFEKWWEFAWKEKQIVTEEIINYVNNLSNKRVKKALKKFAREFYLNQKDWLVENTWEIIWKVIWKVIWNTKDSVNLILTAWIPYLQEKKLKYSWLKDKYNYEIVNKNSDKIKRLIIYVIKLWYVPNEIIVYEDKPEKFYESWKFLAELFKTKVTVKKQKINENNISETIEQREYKNS